MLTITMTPAAGPGLIHGPGSPMAYLDHCGLMRFSADVKLGQRLTTALHAHDGALAISWLNFGEYSTVSYKRERLEVERYLDEVLPAVFCIDVDPVRVIRRERAGHSEPHEDRALAEMFVAAGAQSVRPVTATGLFERLYNSGLAETKARMEGTIRGRLEGLRREHSRSRDFREAVSRADTGPDTQAAAPTQAILRTLAATFFPDRRRRITPNDASDFLHAVVPVAYCDAVLLDGGTWDRVERARRKLSRAGIRMARAFPMRRNGVERFLAYLEGA